MSIAFTPIRAHFVPSQQRGRDIAVYILPDNSDLCYEWYYQLQLNDGVSLLYMCCGCKALRSKDKRTYTKPVASCRIVDGFFVTDPVDTRRPHFCQPRPTLKALVRRLIIGKCNEVRERVPDGRPAGQELNELLSKISKEQIGNLTEAQRLTMIEEITSSSEYARDNARRVIQRAQQKARRQGGRHDKMKQYLCIVCLKVREYPFERKPPFNLRHVSVLLATLVLFNNLDIGVANEIYTACAMYRKVLCKDHYLEAAASLITEISKQSSLVQQRVDLNALHISEKMVPNNLVTLLDEQCMFFGTREVVTARSVAFFLNDVIAYCVDKRNLKEGPECVVPVEKLEQDDQEDGDSESSSSSVEMFSEASSPAERLLSVLQAFSEKSAQMQAEDLLQTEDYEAVSSTLDEASTSFSTSSSVNEEAKRDMHCSTLTPTLLGAPEENKSSTVVPLSPCGDSVLRSPPAKEFSVSLSSEEHMLAVAQGMNEMNANVQAEDLLQKEYQHATSSTLDEASTSFSTSVREEAEVHMSCSNSAPTLLSVSKENGKSTSLPLSLNEAEEKSDYPSMHASLHASSGRNSTLSPTSLGTPNGISDLTHPVDSTPEELIFMLPTSPSSPKQNCFTLLPTTLTTPKVEPSSASIPALYDAPKETTFSLSPISLDIPKELNSTLTSQSHAAPLDKCDVSLPTSSGAPMQNTAVFKEPKEESHSSLLPASPNSSLTNSKSNLTSFEATRELNTTPTPSLCGAEQEVAKLTPINTSLSGSDGEPVVSRSSELLEDRTTSPLPKKKKRSLTPKSKSVKVRVDSSNSETSNEHVNKTSTNPTKAQPSGGPSPSTDADVLSKILSTRKRRPYSSLGNLVSQLSTKNWNIPWSSRLFVVEGSQLLRLLRYCPGCGTNIKSSGTDFNLSSEGAVPIVEIFCQVCLKQDGEYVRWKGQEGPDASASV